MLRKYVVQPTYSFFDELGRIVLFAVEAISLLFRPPLFWREILYESYHVATTCIVPVICTVAPIGCILAIQSLNILRPLGVEKLMSSMVVIILVRELSPAMTSIMIAAQAGTSMAAELGTMRVKEEIDAQDVMAVNPIQYLVIPRFVALFIMCPVLTVIAFFVGMAGSYVISVYVEGVNKGAFLDGLWTYLEMYDVAGAILKACVFGLVVAVISCYKGFYVTGGAAGVGRAANDAVVICITTFLILNYFLTSLIWIAS
jgi:phospholipid/cholesterol/gamma-HCH transport system permease protein